MEVGHPPHPTLPDIWEEFLISEAWRWLLSNWGNTSRSHNWLSVWNLRNICNFSKGEGGWVLENQSFNNFNIAQENWFWGLSRMQIHKEATTIGSTSSPVPILCSARLFPFFARSANSVYSGVFSSQEPLVLIWSQTKRNEDWGYVK